jgi:hypothetical protein
MYSMPFTGKFADSLFPPPLLVLPLLYLMFVMLLLVIHDSFLGLMPTRETTARFCTQKGAPVADKTNLSERI